MLHGLEAGDHGLDAGARALVLLQQAGAFRHERLLLLAKGAVLLLELPAQGEELVQAGLYPGKFALEAVAAWIRLTHGANIGLRRMAGQTRDSPAGRAPAVLAFAGMTDHTHLPAEALLEAFGAEPLAQWHGTLTGLLCGAPPDAARRFLKTLDAPDGAVLPEVDAPQGSVVAADLERLAALTEASLADDGSEFQPMLSEQTPLSERALALGQWCQGFLYGLVNTTRRDLLDRGELGEVLDDFAQISRAGRGSEDAEVAENAYAELVEFVRVGVMLCYETLRGERERWPVQGGDAGSGGPGERLQ